LVTVVAFSDWQQRYEAGRRPTKVALRDLYLLDEELELISVIYKQQRTALHAFGQVIDSRRYRISTRERQRVNEIYERPALIHSLITSPLPGLSYTARDLHGQINKTAQVLRFNIEIAEEGNTKAIRVFTLVTIVFLPLSFISSVFGMNTADIRNMNSSQGLFWTIAIPVTALIGGFSLLIAYYGSQMWTWIKGTYYDVRHTPIMQSKPHMRDGRRRQRPEDEENMYEGLLTYRARKEISNKKLKKYNM
jgi:hypothetical protein